MGLSNIKNVVTTVVSKGGIVLQKNAPVIAMTVGICGVVTATVISCKATLKCATIMEHYNSTIDQMNTACETQPDDVYSSDDKNNDLMTLRTQTLVQIVEVYGPAVLIMLFSIGCIISSHQILSKRNASIVAAYKLVDESFKEYRKRVISEYGESKDFHFRYGTKENETVVTEVDASGKKTKVKKTSQDLSGLEGSMYARLFEKQEFEHGGTWSGSSQFSPNHKYNYAYIIGKQDWFNERLDATGFVFLNDVYEELGFPRTAVGQQVGWVKGNGDGYISFGDAVDYLAYSDGDPILLDFNVDGFVLDII